MVMFFAIFLQGGLLLSSLNDEKKSRILDTILTAITVEALLVGKVLGIAVQDVHDPERWPCEKQGAMLGLRKAAGPHA